MAPYKYPVKFDFFKLKFELIPSNYYNKNMSKLNSSKWIYKYSNSDPFYYNKKGEWVAWKKLTPEEKEEYRKDGKLSLTSDEGKPLLILEEIIEFMKNKKRRRELQESKKINQYLSMINKIPALTSEEEYELWKKIREKGDEEAAEKVFSANLKLVISEAEEYKDSFLTFSELIRE